MSEPGTASAALSDTRTDRLLGGIERAGNKLPEPFVLFVGLFVVVAVVSSAMALADVRVTVPGADEETVVRGLFSGEGVAWFFTTVVENFVGFPPLGTVVTILLAVGLAERTGLLAALVRLAFGSAPRWALPYAVAFVGVVGSIMSDSVMIVVPPLAAMVFHAAGRHPVAGLLGGFAAAGAGYSTSVVVTSLDALFAGITTAVTQTLPDPGTPVTPVSNYFFNVVSSLVLTAVAGLVISKVLEPRLERAGVPRERAAVDDDDGGTTSSGSGSGGVPAATEDPTTEVTPRERSGLRRAGLVALLVGVAVVVLAVVPASPLRNGTGGYLPESPLLDSTVFVVLVMFALPALAYGVRTGVIAGASDVPRLMAAAVRDMAPFVVLAFVLGQFIALFNWSGLGSWLAVTGAQGLESIGLTGYAAILGFILLCSLLNLFIVSGSSMWTLMAAVFVPLFALLGYEPGFVQAAFRVGDSATQILTPLNPYMVVVLAFLRRWEPQAGLGTLMARMLPFSVTFWISWVVILSVFYLAGLPFGPGQYARM